PAMDDVPVSEALQRLEREPVLRALGLLEAQHVRRDLMEEAAHLLDAQADGIDVPGGDGEAHARFLTGRRHCGARRAPRSSPTGCAAAPRAARPYFGSSIRS